MYWHRIAGLNVASELRLPGAAEVAASPSADVTIRRGRAPMQLDQPSASGPTWQLSGARLLLSVPGVSRFVLSDGSEIVFSPESDERLADAGVFMLAPVLGLLLHQRGEAVLRASAVLVGGRAVLFCGPSGAGKSTLAAALNRRGYPIVADDMCALSFEAPGPPRVWPEGCSLKLWSEAIDQLGLQRGAPVRAGLQKFHVDAGAAPLDPVPLGAIYVLRAGRPPDAGIERANIMDAVMLVRRSAYRPRLIDDMDQKAAYFSAAARIGDTTGLFSITRPLQLARMDEVLARLSAHWLAVGLMDQAA